MAQDGGDGELPITTEFANQHPWLANLPWLSTTEGTPTHPYVVIADRVRGHLGYGVDPLLFGMIVENEINNRWWENVVFRSFDALSGSLTSRLFEEANDQPFSYGLAQIQWGTAQATLDRHREFFEHLGYGTVFGDNPAEYESNLRWRLLYSDEFNLLVAATHLADLQRDITDFLNFTHFSEGVFPISSSLTNKLVTLAWNRGYKATTRLILAYPQHIPQMLNSPEISTHINNVSFQEVKVRELLNR